MTQDAVALLSGDILTTESEVPPPRTKKSRPYVAPAMGDVAPSWNAKGSKSAESSTCKEGAYSPEETRLVIEAMDQYIKENGLGGGDIMEGRRILASQSSHLESCRGAWLEIARVLPHRSVSSVYGHGIRKIHAGNNRGKWTDEDVHMLRTLVAEHGRKWKLIVSY